MSTADIRNQLHLVINEADEALLQMLYKVANDYPAAKQRVEDFPAEDMAIFEQRRQARLQGDSVTTPLNELRSKLASKPS